MFKFYFFHAKLCRSAVVFSAQIKKSSLYPLYPAPLPPPVGIVMTIARSQPYRLQLVGTIYPPHLSIGEKILQCGHLPTSLVCSHTSGCIPATLDSTCTVPVYKLICNCK